MIADVVLAGFLELGTAAPSPVRRERWVAHIDDLTSETPLPEQFATYADQAAMTSVPGGTPIRAEVEYSAAENTEQTVTDNSKDITRQFQQVQQDPNGPPEQPANIKDLHEALTFAQIVARVMPVHEDLDRRAARALRTRTARQQPRKLSQK